MFWRVAFGAGFVVIELGALAETKTAVIPIIIGVGIIVWAVWRPARRRTRPKAPP